MEVVLLDGGSKTNGIVTFKHENATIKLNAPQNKVDVIAETPFSSWLPLYLVDGENG